MSKYKAVRTFFDNQWFDSKREAERWAELQITQRAGIIRDLKRQVPFDLFGCELRDKKPVKICRYLADFVYQECGTGRIVIEDSKGVKTRDYVLKKKLFEACYGLRILET